MLFGPAKEFNEELLPRIADGFKMFDTLLEGKKYAAGDTLTLADLALVTSVATYEALSYDFSKHSNVCKWFAKIKNEVVDYKEAIDKYMLMLKQYYDNFQKK